MVSPATRRGERSDRPGGGDRRGGRGGRGRDREQRPREDDSGGFTERVVHTRRIAKVVKGGRRLRFNALVVVGDGQGRVGAGMGKALAIPDAVRKGNAVARRGTITIPIKGSTIPHEISVRKGASIVIIKPAPPGTGVIAAGAMRAMLELGGVRDVVGKSLGSRNPINIVKATLEALSLLRDPVTERVARLGLATPSTNGATAESPAAEPASEPAAAAPAPAATPEPPVAAAATPAEAAVPAPAAPPVVEDATPAETATPEPPAPTADAPPPEVAAEAPVTADSTPEAETTPEIAAPEPSAPAEPNGSAPDGGAPNGDSPDGDAASA